MPELPEVETTRKGILPYIDQQTVTKITVRQPRLRWLVPDAIHDMENKYSVNLAGVVMRIVVKDLRIDELSNFFVYTIGINSDKSNALIKELKARVFSEIANYLDYINKVEEAPVKKDDLSDQQYVKEAAHVNQYCFFRFK